MFPPASRLQIRYRPRLRHAPRSGNLRRFPASLGDWRGDIAPHALPTMLPRSFIKISQGHDEYKENSADG